MWVPRGSSIRRPQAHAYEPVRIGGPSVMSPICPEAQLVILP